MGAIENNDEYDELLLDLYSLTRECGITINTINDVFIDHNKFKDLNAIVWLKTTINNEVLFNNPFTKCGNYDFKLMMLKYKVYIKWYDKTNAYLCYNNTYFINRPDHRVLCDDYSTIILGLKKVAIHKPLKVWSLNDSDYFTTSKETIFNEYPNTLAIVSIYDDGYDEEDGEDDFNNFIEQYDLEMINLNSNLLLFSKNEH